MILELWAKRRWWVEPFLAVSYWVLLPASKVMPSEWTGKCLDAIGYVLGRWGVRVGAK
jgi:hypothetical protein